MRQTIIGRFRHPDGSVGRIDIECEAAMDRADASVRPGQVFSDLPPESATPDGSPHPGICETALSR